MDTVLHMPNDAAELLTIAEAAAFLRVSYSTLRRWEAAGQIAVERTPTGQRRYRRAEVDAVLTGRTAA